MPGSKDAPETMLRGADAAIEILRRAEIQVAAKEPVQLDAISPLQIYGWLLDKAAKAKVDRITNDIVKADAAAMHATNLMKDGKPEAKAKTQRKKVGLSARQTVLDLLR